MGISHRVVRQRASVLVPQLGLDLAVLLVTVPRWTRLNLYATPPDAPIRQPVTDAVIVVSAISRLGGRRELVRPRIHQPGWTVEELTGTQAA